MEWRKRSLTISAAFAELERETIRERVTVVKADQRSRNRYLGGKVPFGFRVGQDGELVEGIAEQAAIKYTREAWAEGKTLRYIQRSMMMLCLRKVSLDAISYITSDKS